MTTTNNASNLRAITLGRAKTVHISEYFLNENNRPIATGFPLCGQAQGRRMQGTRPVTHVSYDLGKVTCAKCANAAADQ